MWEAEPWESIRISRPRRFGKFMAANMLAAYYGKGYDSRKLFKDLKIVETDSFETHLNQYDVVLLNMQEFLSRTNNMQDIYKNTKRSFVIIIDEWDCIFREYKNHREAQEEYLDFLRDMLKDKEYVALAYMTGILPIKKYGTHSALNMFDEYSMTNPMELAEFVGVTEEEVEELCRRYGVNMLDIKQWYDGKILLVGIKYDKATKEHECVIEEWEK